jgi:hypothetical protein
MPAVFVSLSVLVFLLLALGAVLLFTRLLKAEAEKTRAVRADRAASDAKG